MYCQFPGDFFLTPRNALYIGISSRFTVNSLKPVVNYLARGNRSLADFEYLCTRMLTYPQRRSSPAYLKRGVSLHTTALRLRRFSFDHIG